MRLNWSMKHWGKVNKPLISLVLFPKIHWKDWCWSWNSDTLATWCKELTHLERPWCWKRLKAGGEGDDRGWHGWMASPTQWTWVWINSGSCWWTERPGVLLSMGSQRVRHDWVTELNWVHFSSVTQSCLIQSMDCSKWVSSSHQVAKVLELQLQHQSFQWIFRTDYI